jgi:hypothetical protein
MEAGRWLVRMPVRVWDDFWFRPVSARNLAVCRILLCIVLYMYLLPRFPWVPGRGLEAMTWLPESLWKAPDSVLRRLGWEQSPPDLGDIKAIWAACAAATFLSLIGLRTRVATLTMSVTALYLLTLGVSWGKVSHGQSLLGMCLLVLPLAPSGRAYAVDAWLARRAGKPLMDLSPHHRWPVQLFQMTYGMMLLFATMNKMKRSGWDWVTSVNLRNLILRANFGNADPDPSWLAVWVAGEPYRWQMAAGAAVCTQALFILFVFVENRWFRAVWFTFALGFVVGLDVFMDLPNRGMMVLLGMFLPWAVLHDRFAAWRAERAGRVQPL